MSQLQSLIEQYIDCYNRVDLDEMISYVTDDVVFENISNSGQSMQLRGKAALRQVAEASAQAFTSRRQQLSNIVCDGKSAAAEIKFQGIAAMNLPNGTQAGQTVSIRGVSMFSMKDGLLSRIADYS